MRSSHLLGNSRAGLVSSTVLLRIEFTATDASTPMRALLPHVSTLTSFVERNSISFAAPQSGTAHTFRSFSSAVKAGALPAGGRENGFRSLSSAAKAGPCRLICADGKHSCGFPCWYKGRGGIFLLHFSSDRSGRALPVILALWSPDFPHDAAVGPHPATVRPGRAFIVLDWARNVKQVAIFF